ncbi:hypothetical protein K438DRAFT_1879069 [Mycena galopus ATCC 62051]|nr:hypothetical protein K438DRAFT_1879069 [Mycena galopus ATCC 62051]
MGWLHPPDPLHHRWKPQAGLPDEVGCPPTLPCQAAARGRPLVLLHTPHRRAQAQNVVLVKQGEGEITGLTGDMLPKRLGPKRATKIKCFFNLSKEDDVRVHCVAGGHPEERGREAVYQDPAPGHPHAPPAPPSPQVAHPPEN